MSDERHAFTITNGEVSTVPARAGGSRRLWRSSWSRALLISFYDLLLLALGL